MQRRRGMFFFNDAATTEIYTLSLHDALPISVLQTEVVQSTTGFHQHIMNMFSPKPQLLLDNPIAFHTANDMFNTEDRKSTRLNSSHANISYAVFCLKKKIPLFPYSVSSYFFS